LSLSFFSHVISYPCPNLMSQRRTEQNLVSPWRSISIYFRDYTNNVHGLPSFDEKVRHSGPCTNFNIQPLTRLRLVDSPTGCELINIKNLFGHASLLVNLWLRGDSSLPYVEQSSNANIDQCPSVRKLVHLELASFLSFLWSASGYTVIVRESICTQPFFLIRSLSQLGY
jgi:hypothetical protein